MSHFCSIQLNWTCAFFPSQKHDAAWSSLVSITNAVFIYIKQCFSYAMCFCPAFSHSFHVSLFPLSFPPCSHSPSWAHSLTLSSVQMVRARWPHTLRLILLKVSGNRKKLFLSTVARLWKFNFGWWLRCTEWYLNYRLLSGATENQDSIYCH